MHLPGPCRGVTRRALSDDETSPCRGVTLRALSNDEASYHQWSMKHRETKTHRQWDRVRSNCITASTYRERALARPRRCPRPSRGARPTVKTEGAYPSRVGASQGT